MQDLNPIKVDVNVAVLSRPARVRRPDEMVIPQIEINTGHWKLEQVTHNLVVTAGKVLLVKMLAEQSGFDTGITYCEVGTNTTAPAIGDTNIGTVTKRNAITAYRLVSNRCQFRTFFEASSIAANLKAAGLYGHSTATATNQTGELFNHSKIDFDNSSGSKDLTMVMEVTVS